MMTKASRGNILLYDFLLLLVAFFWGSTFVLVKKAVSLTDVFSFLGIRFLLAAIVLGLAVAPRWRRLDRGTAWRGAVLGIILFLSYAFQTVGLTMTSASNAGFITGLSVVMVPLLLALIFRALPNPSAALGVAMAAGGLYLMTGAGGGGIAGDLLVLVCALFVAAHIILTGRFVRGRDPYLLAAAQLAALAVCGLIAMALSPGKRLSAAPVVVWAWIITVLFATIFAFVVQTAAQRVISPTSTALIFTMEPVFAAVFARVFGGEKLSASGMAGGALILGGMLVSELARAKIDSLGEKAENGPRRTAKGGRAMKEKIEPVEVYCPRCGRTQIIYLPKEKVPLCPSCNIEMAIRELLDEGKSY